MGKREQRQEQKRLLRARYIALRKAVADVERKSSRIAANAFSLLQRSGAELVLIYHRIGSEADAAPLADLLIDFGLGVAFPYCRPDGGLGVGRVLNPRENLVAGPRGIMEPADAMKGNVSPRQIGAVVCPGVAFDAALTRLGRGGGHYDRFLAKLPKNTLIIGAAFDCQISEAPLPRDTRDVPMGAVVTESRAFPTGCCPAIKPPDEEASESCPPPSSG
jgi:5-formyltetrahydrofolate cyclo-ligase